MGATNFVLQDIYLFLVQSQLWHGLLHNILTLWSLNIASLMEYRYSCPLRWLDPGKIMCHKLRWSITCSDTLLHPCTPVSWSVPGPFECINIPQWPIRHSLSMSNCRNSGNSGRLNFVRPLMHIVMSCKKMSTRTCQRSQHGPRSLNYHLETQMNKQGWIDKHRSHLSHHWVTKTSQAGCIPMVWKVAIDMPQCIIYDL